MKVICRDNKGHSYLLTIGVVYDVVDKNEFQIKIKDNSERDNWYKPDRFVDYTSYVREKKLKKLGI
jgi:hypothetical protein